MKMLQTGSRYLSPAPDIWLTSDRADRDPPLFSSELHPCLWGSVATYAIHRMSSMMAINTHNCAISHQFPSYGWLLVEFSLLTKGASFKAFVGGNRQRISGLDFIKKLAYTAESLDKTSKRDGQTDRRTDLLWLIQRSALRAMRTRCKK